MARRARLPLWIAALSLASSLWAAKGDFSVYLNPGDPLPPIPPARLNSVRRIYDQRYVITLDEKGAPILRTLPITAEKKALLTALKRREDFEEVPVAGIDLHPADGRFAPYGFKVILKDPRWGAYMARALPARAKQDGYRFLAIRLDEIGMDYGPWFESFAKEAAAQGIQPVAVLVPACSGCDQRRILEIQAMQERVVRAASSALLFADVQPDFTAHDSKIKFGKPKDVEGTETILGAVLGDVDHPKVEVQVCLGGTLIAQKGGRGLKVERNINAGDWPWIHHNVWHEGLPPASPTVLDPGLAAVEWSGNILLPLSLRQDQHRSLSHFVDKAISRRRIELDG
jgi:hypothetical protein